MVYKRIESFAKTKPLEIDDISSKYVVYFRRNIVSVPDVDSTGRQLGTTHWEMDEAQMSKEDYAKYKSDLNSPIISILLQQMNDLKANQELAEIKYDELTGLLQNLLKTNEEA